VAATNIDNLDIRERLAKEKVAGSFSPYVEHSPQADALNVYFKNEADYSKRLTDHVTLFLAIDSDEIVGCRIKGISSILEDLPNYIDVEHGGNKLSVIFWSFRGGAEDEYVRDALNRLAQLSNEVGGLDLEPSQS